MAAHPSCTWNRCRIVFRGEGRRRRRRRRIVYRKGIYRGFEVCPRGAQRRRGRINGTGREDFHRWTRDRISIVSRAKGKNIVNVPPKKEIYFRPIFFSFSLLFLFRERERETYEFFPLLCLRRKRFERIIFIPRAPLENRKNFKVAGA